MTRTKADAAINLARAQMRSFHQEWRKLEKDLDDARESLAKSAAAFVDILELFQDLQGALEQDQVDKTRAGDLMSGYLEEGWEQLHQAGIELIGEVGEPFDASRHRIVKSVHQPDAEDKSVVKVLNHGISCGSMPIRPAKVIIAKSEV